MPTPSPAAQPVSPHQMNESSINVEGLLAPISPELPCGSELDRSDAGGSYYRVKNLRDKALTAEEAHARADVGGMSDEEREQLPAPPDWEAVIGAASETIASESKDFRLACWLCEALLREEGYLGLNEGLLLCRGLCERYWADLFPRPNDDGHLDTVSPLTGVMGQTVCRLLRLWPITPEHNGAAYSVWDYKQASGGGGNESTADIKAAAAAAGPNYYPGLTDAIDTAIETLGWLAGFLEDNCLPDSYGESTHPSVSALREELEDSQRVIRGMDIDVAAEGVDEDSASGVTEAGTAATVVAAHGVINTRNDALKNLGKVAEYFEKTEPHSPISYALRQVMGWGRMSLPELLAELISDRSVRDDLQRRVGVPFSDDE